MLVVIVIFFHFRIVLRAGVVKKLYGERPRGRDCEDVRQVGRGGGVSIVDGDDFGRVRKKFSPALSVSRPCNRCTTNARFSDRTDDSWPL